MNHKVTLIEGDGIGPEVMNAAKAVIKALGVSIDWEVAAAGRKAFEGGIVSGVPQETIESLSRTRIALKGPLETPIGFGGKSANVTLRKFFETFANIRPVKEITGVVTPFSGRGIDLVVVRENVEDLYAGIEHGQTPDVAQCLKLISTKGSEKISRLAFELARAEGRKSIDVATKANIMKKTEGMVKSVFEAVSTDYPDIEARHLLIDNCAHQLVIRPEQFEIILTTNMNGDIISDLTSGLVGGLGLAASGNIGHDCAIFEAVHGSAPDIAGKDKANPTAILFSAVLLLRHLGELEAAARMEAAVLTTLADGPAWPGDIAKGRPISGTTAFTEAVIANLSTVEGSSLGRTYRKLEVPVKKASVKVRFPEDRAVQGIDLFIEFDGTAAELGGILEEAADRCLLKLKMISNRGTMVYPDNGASTDCVDHWRCRFVVPEALSDIPSVEIGRLIERVDAAGLRWMHIEKLNVFDGEPAYTLAQGEN